MTKLAFPLVARAQAALLLPAGASERLSMMIAVSRGGDDEDDSRSWSRRLLSIYFSPSID